MQLDELTTTFLEFTELSKLDRAIIVIEQDGSCTVRNTFNSILIESDSANELARFLQERVSVMKISHVRAEEIFGSPRGNTFGKTRKLPEIDATMDLTLAYTEEKTKTVTITIEVE